MKTIVFHIERIALSSMLISALIATGTVPDGLIRSGTSPSRSEQEHSGPGTFLLAEIADTEEHIIYRTDPDLEREAEEQAQEEKNKEDKAWRMLDNTYIFKGDGKGPHRRPNDINRQ